MTHSKINSLLRQAEQQKSEEILGKGGRAYLKELENDRDKALAFFRRAGILTKNGKLTKNYR